MSLSEQAQRLIADFEEQIKKLPAEERNEVIKRMTSHISALNESVKEVFTMVQNTYPKNSMNDIEHISDVL